MPARSARTGVSGTTLLLLSVTCLALLSACGHHRPAPVEEYSATPIRRQLNRDGSYDVRSGDTLYAIAFNYGLDPRDVAEWNGISRPYVIYPGQKLRLSKPPPGSRNSERSDGVRISVAKAPGQATTKTVTSPVKSSPSSSTHVKSSQTQAVQTRKSPTRTAAKPASSSAKKAAAPVKVPVSTADPKRWLWPAKGRVLRGYVAGNPARNGLDIAGREGQPIIASAGGQVVYSGNGLIGYGELIIIKHSEKMLSAYAHNKVRLVSEGDQVSAGQKIAEMGRNTSGEQLLHFEIRVVGKPVNPGTYLPKK